LKWYSPHGEEYLNKCSSMINKFNKRYWTEHCSCQFDCGGFTRPDTECSEGSKSLNCWSGKFSIVPTRWSN
jgi:hypothetical protein